MPQAMPDYKKQARKRFKTAMLPEVTKARQDLVDGVRGRSRAESKRAATLVKPTNGSQADTQMLEKLANQRVRRAHPSGGGDGTVRAAGNPVRSAQSTELRLRGRYAREQRRRQRRAPFPPPGGLRRV